MSLFNVNARNARLHKYIPKHGKAEDVAPAAELQFRNVTVLPSAVSAALLAEGGASEVEWSFFTGDPLVQRFFGIDEVSSTAEYKMRHMMRIDDFDDIRVVLLDKIRFRFEGGPQRIVWADFSVHIEDPTSDQGRYFHEMINRDVDLRLEQDADLVEQMLAKRKGMAVSTEVNGELDLDAKAERDAEQLQQAADALAKPARSRAPKKTAGRKAGKRKAA